MQVKLLISEVVLFGKVCSSSSSKHKRYYAEELNSSAEITMKEKLEDSCIIISSIRSFLRVSFIRDICSFNK